MAERTVAKMQKKGQTLAPVTARRGAIAKSFWGKAWCRNLERYSDYSNRLPRGRTYLRNGSVIDLKIGPGEVSAKVMGSSLYLINVRIAEVTGAHWQAIAGDCARSIDTLVELLQGQLSTSVMERITRPGTGLFPSPKEISFSCSCPDSALMCKHVAATLYGIGARLDAQPELLFGLRKVDAKDLIARAGEGAVPVQKEPGAGRILDSSKLTDIFGIDLGSAEPKPSHKPAVKKRKSPATTKSATGAGKRSARKKSGKAR
jgi:uncharacterized Zn finger protein